MEPTNPNLVVESLTLKRRLVAVWPRTPSELKEMIINRSAGVIWPLTTARIPQDEPVLLDVRVPNSESRVVLRAKCTYTIPEGLGPMFVCAKEDRFAFASLLRAVDEATTLSRAFTRYPAALDATVLVDEQTAPLSARVVDLSAAGAKLEVSGAIPTGANVRISVSDSVPSPLPSLFTARVLGERTGGVAVHFAGPNFEAWHQLRFALRRAHETGVAPPLGV
jgi:hypothetical protein